MVMPLLIGQTFQPTVPPRYKGYLVKINQTLIGFLILQIFSDIVYHGKQIPGATVTQTLILVMCLHIFFLGLSWMLGGILKFSLTDRVACLFCSTHKTVVLGLPLLRTIFYSRSPDQLAELVFPLISYH